MSPDTRADEPPDDLDAEVRALEAKAERSAIAYRGRYFNRAGDLCAAAGEVDRALRLWGRAIDAYLQVARRRAAAATCRKAMNRVPGVVRARCTLAILCVGEGDTEAALRHVDDYVRAAQRADRCELAIRQLRLMARATEDPAIRRRIRELLDELAGGDVRPPPSASLGQPLAEADRWPFLLLAAHMPPDELLQT